MTTATNSASTSFFGRLAERITKFSGSTAAFLVALGIVLVWAVTGPLFHYSETWQLVINTGTTIVTFLMVFLIQRAQNKDSLVLHLKLNELIAATQGASNRLINAQDFSEEEIKTLHEFYSALVELAKKDNEFGKIHSVEEAEGNHNDKLAARTE
ncbi:MAG: low affinity iron permease family protein [Bacteroidota bacterium]|nr:low affinity iron permease family protein [Bacteroidota bacterium]